MLLVWASQLYKFTSPNPSPTTKTQNKTSSLLNLCNRKLWPKTKSQLPKYSEKNQCCLDAVTLRPIQLSNHIPISRPSSCWTAQFVWLQNTYVKWNDEVKVWFGRFVFTSVSVISTPNTDHSRFCLQGSLNLIPHFRPWIGNEVITFFSQSSGRFKWSRALVQDNNDNSTLSWNTILYQA